MQMTQQENVSIHVPLELIIKSKGVYKYVQRNAILIIMQIYPYSVSLHQIVQALLFLTMEMI
jgi:hypothetical protein